MSQIECGMGDTDTKFSLKAYVSPIGKTLNCITQGKRLSESIVL